MKKKKRGRRVKNSFTFYRSFFRPYHIQLIVCIFVLISLALPPGISSAQDFLFDDPDSWSISASNQLEYSSDRKTHQDIFHNWTNVDLGYGIYSASLRYEAHQPDDWGQTWQKLSFRNIKLKSEFLDITAGNFYEIFGRGLILRAYENRDLRHDNNIDGVKGVIDLDGFDLTLLGGTMTGRYERLEDPLHAADGKIAFTDWMTVGGSYLRTNLTDFGLVRLFGGNASLNLPHADFYAEYAEKDNPPSTFLEEDDNGKAIYLSANVYTSGAGLTLEFKDYDRFDFINQDVTYNNPPPLAREHMYTLLNRHAHEVEPFDERGIQAEITSTPVDQLSLLANYSYTTNRDDDLVFSEIYGEAEYDYQDKATLKGGLSRAENRREIGEPIRLVPVADITYYLSDVTSINFILEHLYTEEYDGDITYYNQILSLSLSQSPYASLTFTHERTTEWKVREYWPGKRNWFIGTLDLAMGDNHNLSLSIGSRPEGKVCAGGVCVDKPALDGFEIKLLSRF
jgi:hypothetical protein